MIRLAKLIDTHRRLRQRRYARRMRDMAPLVRIRRMLGLFIILLLLHILAMTLFEGMGVGQALWLTLTTATTVGYGDVSPATPLGRLSTILLLYLGGIFVLGKIASDYFDYRVLRHEKMVKGQWRWEMKDHIVIINAPAKDAETYLGRLVEELRGSRGVAHKEVQILTTRFPEGLPERLRLQNVTHFNGHPNDMDNLMAVDVDDASHVLILARDEHDPASDIYSFDIIHRLKEVGVRGVILAECVEDENRSRMRQAGAHLLLRPIRAYPEMIVRAVETPGSESITEEFFSSKGAFPLRFELAVRDMTWGEVVSRMALKGIGTAIAFQDNDNHMVCYPSPDVPVNAKAIYLMIQEGRQPTMDMARNALRSTSGP